MAGGLVVGGVGSGGGSDSAGGILTGYLQGRAARIAQQQQDLEQQKYEFSKEHQAVLDSQKNQELGTGELTGLTEATKLGGGDYAINLAKVLKLRGFDQDQSAPQPSQAQSGPSSDQSQGPPDLSSPQASAGFIASMGGTPSPGLMAKPTGSGFVAPAQQVGQAANTSKPASQPQSPGGSPNSTVPSVTADSNPGNPMASLQAMHIPSEHEYQQQVFNYQKNLEYDNKIKSDAAAINNKKGHADVVAGPDGRLMIDQKTLDLGPEANATTANLQEGNRSVFGARVERTQNLSNAFNEEIKPAKEITPMVAQAIGGYKEAQAGNPVGDETIMSTLSKMEGQSTNDPGELIKSQSSSQRLKDYAAQMLSGNVTNQTRQAAMKEIQSNYEARAALAPGIAKKYAAKARSAGVDPTTITATPDIDQTVAAGRQLVGSFPEQPAPGQESGFLASLKNKAMGFLNSGSSPSSASAAPKGSPPPVSFEQFKAWKKQNAGQ